MHLKKERQYQAGRTKSLKMEVGTGKDIDTFWGAGHKGSMISLVKYCWQTEKKSRLHTAGKIFLRIPGVIRRTVRSSVKTSIITLRRRTDWGHQTNAQKSKWKAWKADKPLTSPSASPRGTKKKWKESDTFGSGT